MPCVYRFVPGSSATPCRSSPGPCHRQCSYSHPGWRRGRRQPDWVSFLSGKAVAVSASTASSPSCSARSSVATASVIEQLYRLSSKLRKPCLRLRILQQVLGLDTRFSRNIVHGVICLAFDVLEEMGAAKAPQRRNDAAETSAPPRRRRIRSSRRVSRRAGRDGLHPQPRRLRRSYGLMPTRFWEQRAEASERSAGEEAPW